MENIFYAVLALSSAGKPVNKENIRKVLNAAGTPVNEPGLEALAAFVEAIETSQRERTKEKAIDPRIANFLASELTRRKAQTGQLEDALKKLVESVPPVPTQTVSAGQPTDTAPVIETLMAEVRRNHGHVSRITVTMQLPPLRRLPPLLVKDDISMELLPPVSQ